MALLLFENTGFPHWERLKDIVLYRTEYQELELVKDLPHLFDRLHQPNRNWDVVLVPVTNTRALAELFAALKLLANFRLILVLPDTCAEVTQMAHKLYPRYLAQANSDYGDIQLMLHEMLKHPQHSPDERPDYLLVLHEYTEPEQAVSCETLYGSLGG